MKKTSTYLTLILLLIIGCSTSKYDAFLKGYFEVESIHNETIDEFIIIILRGNENKKLVLLSSRLGNEIDKPPFEKYALMEERKKYRLNLVKQDSVYAVNQHFLNPEKPYVLLLERMFFIENDTIKATVYRSDDVFDKFVKIK